MKGKPTNGILIENMKETRRMFKNVLNNCKLNEQKIRDDKLVQNLQNKKFKEFWKEVNYSKKESNRMLHNIDNEANPENIARIFSDKFRLIFDKDNIGKSKAQMTNKVSDQNNVYKTQVFSIQNVHDAIHKLKHSIGPDGIHSNHVKLFTPLCKELFALLFSGFIKHNYMGLDILKGIIGPTIKDKYGNKNDSNNYRPVTSSSVFLKLFEYCLMEKLIDFLNFNDRQHGFRGRYSTSTAYFVLSETVLNYINAGSRVYACFLDISKAFDSVCHGILIEKLIKSGIPSGYVNIIKYWYSNQYVNVRYGNGYSSEWKLCNGIRQGGVLSGILFNLYINDLIDNVSKSKLGCKLGVYTSNIVAYADDLVILTPSRSSLQILIQLINNEIRKIRLNFNSLKSKCMIFDKKCKKNQVLESFSLEEKHLECVNEIKYLGYIIQDNMLSDKDIERARNKFYKEFNVLLRKFNSSSINVKLYLFNQYCVQIYGSELWNDNKKTVGNIKQFSVGYHKAIKKMLGLSYRESNHYACERANMLMFCHLINKNKIYFIKNLLKRPCILIEKLMTFLDISSKFIQEAYEILKTKYQIESIKENDKDAILARIFYIQNHETQMRRAIVDI